MGAITLLADLRMRGVVLSADGGRLHVNAPAGTLTEALRATIQEHKGAIMAALRLEGVIAEVWGNQEHVTVDINDFPEWAEERGLVFDGWNMPDGWPDSKEWPVMRVRVEEQA